VGRDHHGEREGLGLRPEEAWDFDGNYTAGAAEATIGGGAGLATMKNQTGVVIELKSTTQGASLELAAAGIRLSVER